MTSVAGRFRVAHRPTPLPALPMRMEQLSSRFGAVPLEGQKAEVAMPRRLLMLDVELFDIVKALGQ
ncbi:hypothetical protein [Sphingomonas faeni]|uniref:hypothetical protein n=1 Tax=Sphingomonas faeni TaxID=185950 RepID=UPI00334D32D2